jgi:NitT/TauT family transport system substrate-binding protein
VASGRVNLAQTTYVSILQARDENFDLIAVANLDNATDGTLRDGRKDVGGLMVAANSPIQRPRDLEGKKVGVSSVPGILWMFVAQTIRQDGADHTKVNFQEVPFAQMTDVLVNGGIDAGAHLEPFTTVALQGGKVRAIAWPYVDVLPSANLGGLFGRGDWVRSNPNTAAAFTRALRKGMDVMKDDAEARKWIIEYTKMNPELANKMWLSVWNTKVDLKSVEKQRDIMLDMGMLKRKIEPSELFYRTALE